MIAVTYDGPTPQLFTLPDGSVRRPGEIIPHGAMKTYRVPLLFKDHQPHWGTAMNDSKDDTDERQAAYEERKTEMANAWKPPTRPQPVEKPQPPAQGKSSATTPEQ